MRRPHLLPYRPDRPSIVIVKDRVATRGRRYRFELTWVRYVTDGGDIADVFSQQRWDLRTGARHVGELPIDHGTTPAAIFAAYVARYRAITEQADGTPASGQLHLPGLAR